MGFKKSGFAFCGRTGEIPQRNYAIMNINHIYVDTNVIIGAFANNENDKNCLQYLFSLKGKKLYISSLSIAQFVAVFQKKTTAEDLLKKVKYLLTKFNIVSFTEKDIQESLSEKSPDFEDNIQFTICRKVKCQHFITNNIKDYSGYFLLNILKPSQVRKINQ